MSNGENPFKWHNAVGEPNQTKTTNEKKNKTVIYLGRPPLVSRTLQCQPRFIDRKVKMRTRQMRARVRLLHMVPYHTRYGRNIVAAVAIKHENSIRFFFVPTENPYALDYRPTYGVRCVWLEMKNKKKKKIYII